MTMVAALYVAARGCYTNLPDVDAWAPPRDARLYAGPNPVVAHPPCGTHGRYAARTLAGPGNDGGCFEAALEAVKRFGGVLEHPAATHAWAMHQLVKPQQGSWQMDPFSGGWVTEVAQGNYGHRARKLTWLFAVTGAPPLLDWGQCVKHLEIPSDATGEQRARLIKTGVCQRLSKNQRAATPLPFRDLMLGIARSAR